MKNAFTPTQHIKLQDRKLVQVLFGISQVVGLSVPNLFNYNGLAVCFIIYSILICLALLGLCFYTLYQKVYHTYPNIIRTAALLDAVSIVGATIANITSITCAVVFNRKSMVKNAKKLKEIQFTLQEKFLVPHVRTEGLILQFLALEIFIFTYVIFESVFDVMQNGILHYSFAFCMHFNVFLMSITVLQIQFNSTCIKKYFQVTNRKLLEVMQYSGEFHRKQQNIDMNFFLKLYDKLCDSIELVSASYGIQITLISFIIILSLIESMNLLLKFALGFEKFGDNWKLYMLIADTWNSIIYILFGVMLAVSCDQTSTEVSNTSNVSYKILLDYPSCPKSQLEEVTRNELLLLADHLSHRKVQFSASGFFSVDHTMLYMIFGSIAAYLVIVLQFT